MFYFSINKESVKFYGTGPSRGLEWSLPSGNGDLRPLRERGEDVLTLQLNHVSRDEQGRHERQAESDDNDGENDGDKKESLDYIQHMKPQYP